MPHEIKTNLMEVYLDSTHQAALPLAELTPSGQFIYVNQQFSSVFGYEPGELVDLHHSVLLDRDESVSVNYFSFWSSLRNGKSISAQFERLRKNSERIWVEATYIPICGIDGKVHKVLKLVRDITAEKTNAIENHAKITAIESTMMFAEFDAEGVLRGVNTKYAEVFGYLPAEVIGKHHSQFVSPHYAKSPAYQMFWHELRKGIHQESQFFRIGKWGREIWMQATYAPVLDAFGQLNKIVKFATNITQQKVAEIEREEQLSALSKAMSVAEFSLEGIFLDVNSNFTQIFGYSQNELKGMHHSAIVPLNDARSAGYQLFWQNLRNGKFQNGLFQRKAKNGDLVWIESSYSVVCGTDGQPYKIIKVARDVTKQTLLEQQRNEELFTAARRDALTGAFSKFGLSEAYQVMQASKSIANQVMVIRLDVINFRGINKMYGATQFGDSLLIGIYKKLQLVLSDSAAIARFSADEFALIIVEPSLLKAENYISLLLTELTKPMSVGSRTATLNYNFGIAVGSLEDPLELILQHATCALQYEKMHRDNGYRIYDYLLADALNYERSITDLLLSAVEKADIKPKLKAIYDTAHVLTGFELTASWHDSKLGEVAPELFIPAAEKLGLLNLLTERLITAAVNQGKFQPGQHSLHLHISTQQLLDRLFYQTLLEYLSHHQLASSQLVLVITEAIVHEPNQVIISAITRFKAAKFKLCLGEFGGGTSSLLQLSSYGIDQVKFADQLITDLQQTEESRAIFTALRFLCRSLNIEVLVGQLDSQPLLTLLEPYQCDYLQGEALNSIAAT